MRRYVAVSRFVVLQRFAQRRFLDFLGEVFREATVFSTAKSSSFAPAFSFSRSQTGCAPRPAHVLPDLSRYLTGTLRPFSEVRRPLFVLPSSPPSLISWSFNWSARRLRTFSMSSRSFKSPSTDIEARGVFAMAFSPAKHSL